MKQITDIPNVVFIGAKESGKSATIQRLWNTSKTSFCYEEFLDGRGTIRYKISELPFISFSIESEITGWIHDDFNRTSLQESDVVVFVIPIDNITFSRKAKFIQELKASTILKADVKLVIALSQIESSVDIGIFHNTPLISLDECSKILSVRDVFYNEFKRFIKSYDFEITDVVPYSYEITWQLQELKNCIVEGVVKRHNDIVYDSSCSTIVFIGKTGCGKSSTINTLCGTNLPVDGSVACTKYPIVICKNISNKTETLKVNIVDLPGIAESLDANLMYSDYYSKYLKCADVIVCLSQANTRAYKQDQEFYSQMINAGVISKETKIILGINKIDLIFKSDENLDGIELHSISDTNPLIQDKITDYYDNIFSKIFAGFKDVSRDSIVVYSNMQNWNIEKIANKVFQLAKKEKIINT